MLLSIFFFVAAVLPDFVQVYNFIGSVFDPAVTGHLQKLKKMDRIDVETVYSLICAVSLVLWLNSLSCDLSFPLFA